MKVMSLRRTPENPDVIEVHLDIASTLCAVGQSLIWYAAWAVFVCGLDRAFFR